MSTDHDARAIAAHLLAREGHLLDTRQWDAWLSLYAPDCSWWVPSWRDEDHLVEDVEREVSLAWHPSRAGLEERVLRIRTRKSVTSMPLPRTTHLSSNVLAQFEGEHTIVGTASWQVHDWDPRLVRAQHRFGRYEYTLRLDDTAWRFTRKKIIVCNDLFPGVVDFYHL
ncbi:aromatic-ring-hydroxylating dioxygenase subunit beta [Ramlibacter sp. AN1015]|uniref:aromatic-ring-hydroxylating dioxygenase subunit beta n=1 Tax=Ramlibacter sp. AN1015 TaxID=3133428 RepID=UPI0030C22051